MRSPRIEQLDLPRIRPSPTKGSRLWREWCFARVVFRHFRVRFLLMAGILQLGGFMFIVFEPEKRHSLPQAMFYAWSLVFGEAPEHFRVIPRCA